MPNKIRKAMYITPKTEKRINQWMKDNKCFLGAAVDMAFEELSRKSENDRQLLDKKDMLLQFENVQKGIEQVQKDMKQMQTGVVQTIEQSHNILHENQNNIEQKIDAALEEAFKSRKAGNSSDRKSAVLIELMNTLILHHEIEEAILTSNPELKSQALIEAEEAVSERITGMKQRKDDKVLREKKKQVKVSESASAPKKPSFYNPYGEN